MATAVSIFSAKAYDRAFLTAANADGALDLRFLAPRLSAETAALAEGSEAVCVFVNDQADAAAVARLAEAGLRRNALRCARCNTHAQATSAAAGISVAR
ncbi:MAG: 2-hydroxyacid dehydrogenase, partial [Rubrimonas sp.]